MQNHPLLIQADCRVGGIVGLLIQVEHILHCGDEFRPDAWDAPFPVLPRFELVLFKRERMVSMEICSP
jgi:hypothetical protein